MILYMFFRKSAPTPVRSASAPVRAETEAAVDAGAELLSEVSQKATFPMRFGRYQVGTQIERRCE